MTQTRRWLNRAAAPLRAGGLATRGLAALAAGLAALALGVWLAGRGVFAPVPAAALAWWLATGAAAAWAAWRIRRHLPPGTPRRLAAWIERKGNWRRGSLWAVSERAQPGASPALFDAADVAARRRLESDGSAALRGLTRTSIGQTLLAGVALLLAATVFVLLRPTSGRAADLWRPVALMFKSRAGISIAADRAEVRAGERARLAIDAPGAQRVRLWTRSLGESWHETLVALDSSGHATFESPPLEADLLAHVTDGARHSDTVRVAVRQTLFVARLEITANFPPHVGRAPEPVLPSPDTMWLPAGTVLEVAGEVPGATLSAARWESRGGHAALAVTGARFFGRLSPRRTGRWELAVEAADGRRLEDAPPAITVGIVPDRVPEVLVVTPESNATLPVSLLQPLVAEAVDDYGLTEAVAVLRRVSRLGLSGEPWTVPLAGGQGVGERAIVTAGLNLSDRGLLPGDTVRLRVRVADNAPVPQWGESQEIVLRLPSLAELRDETRRDAQAIADAADSVTARQQELTRQTEALAAERQRSESTATDPTNRGGDALDFERSERARAIVEEQEAVVQRVEELRQRLEALERAADASGMSDPEWQRQLAELEELLKQALTPELEERLAELKQALEQLDETATREALDRLAEAQAALRAELERSRELFERAAIEGALESLAQDAGDLQAEQERWVDEIERRADSSAAQRERELAQRADSMAQALGEMAERVGERANEAQRQQMEGSRQQAGEAGASMQQAANSAARGDQRSASQQGSEAAQSLGELSQSLRDQRQSLAQQWRQEAMAALDRSLSETARLAADQEAVIEQLRSGASASDLRARQGAIEQGVRQLGEQLEEASGRNALLSPRLAGSLGLAGELMAQARGQLERPTPNGREAAQLADEALDALNAAAYGLVRSREQVAGSQSGSGLAEALEQMGELARQQGGLNGQAGDLLPRMGGGAGVLEELQRLAREQRALAEQLDRLAAGGQAPSATEPLADEANAVAEELERGRLDPEVLERQEQLFRRLLDAGRSLRDDETDPNRERQSETARAQETRTPDALPPGVGGVARYRYPTWEELAPLTPEARRLVLEYFRRLNDERPDR